MCASASLPLRVPALLFRCAVVSRSNFGTSFLIRGPDGAISTSVNELETISFSVECWQKEECII